MLFNSFSFLIFFPVVALVFRVVPKKLRYIWLLIASYFFYGCWDVRYLSLIIISTFITYLSGIYIDKVSKINHKKIIVALSFVANLGILFYFKYFEFAIENINKILAGIHMTPVELSYSVVLPVGISFYIFQALSYTVDVYRGDIKHESNLLKYALFVSFFPQLVAGPIERSKNLLGQIKEIEKIDVWDYDRTVSGLIMMWFGLFMKMVIADRLAIFVQFVFDNTASMGTIELVLAAVAFSIQIYCDFGGYSMIAIGAARVMGFALMENFNTPYMATGIKDFWRRWHISLSTWFRDYLYIPLGGSRCSKVRKYFNLMVTFLCSGLWHGASWSFVAWGGIHGCLQVVEDLIKPLNDKIDSVSSNRFAKSVVTVIRILVTFALVTFSWIFFKAGTIKNAVLYIARMFTKFDLDVIRSRRIFEMGLDRIEVKVLIVALAVLLFTELLKYVKGMGVADFIMRLNVVVRFVIMILLIVSVFVFGEYGVDFESAQFIYFDF